MRRKRAHRYTRGRRFEPPARRHFMPEFALVRRAVFLGVVRRPYAARFTAEAARPFLIVATTIGRRESQLPSALTVPLAMPCHLSA